MTTNRVISVLVVEDDPAGRAMLALNLRQAGYEVQSATDGGQALEFLAGHRFDWMITDGRMAPMDGCELSLRAKKLQPDMRIIMTSAAYTEKDVRGFPIEKLFAKPLPIDNVLAWLSAGTRHDV